jgi:hypothetical protein
MKGGDTMAEAIFVAAALCTVYLTVRQLARDVTVWRRLRRKAKSRD